MKANCALCGEYRTMTGEHLIAKWIGKIINYDNPITISTFSLGEEFERTYDTHFGGHKELKVPVLCEPCNSEWSSKIQNDNSKFLKHIITGESWRLSSPERERLATWMSLFTIIRQLVRPELAALDKNVRLEFFNSTTKIRNSRSKKIKLY